MEISIPMDIVIDAELEKVRRQRKAPTTQIFIEAPRRDRHVDEVLYEEDVVQYDEGSDDEEDGVYIIRM